MQGIALRSQLGRRVYAAFVALQRLIRAQAVDSTYVTTAAHFGALYTEQHLMPLSPMQPMVALARDGVGYTNRRAHHEHSWCLGEPPSARRSADRSSADVQCKRLKRFHVVKCRVSDLRDLSVASSSYRPAIRSVIVERHAQLVSRPSISTSTSGVTHDRVAPRKASIFEAPQCFGRRLTARSLS